MKWISLLTALIICSACGSRKETASAQDTAATTETTTVAEAETAEDTFTIGVVHVTETGCLVYIDAQKEDGKVKMYPINLEEHFRKEGVKLKFQYTISRAMQPAGCEAEWAVRLENVAAVRE